MNDEATVSLDWRGRLASGNKRDLSRIFRFIAEAVRLDGGGKRVNGGVSRPFERVREEALLAMVAGDNKETGVSTGDYEVNTTTYIRLLSDLLRLRATQRDSTRDNTTFREVPATCFKTRLHFLLAEKETGN